MTLSASGVFISYRRTDASEAYARLLAAALDIASWSDDANVLSVQPIDFEDFFGKNAPKVHGWLASRCGSDKTVAEDLVQEAFTQALGRWDKVGTYEDPLGWVFLVAKQMLLRYLRKLDNSSPELPELQDDRIGGTESFLDFDRALQDLSDAQRAVTFLVLRFQYTPAEAAKELGLKESTVRSHLHRARQQLKRKHLIDPPDPGLLGNEEGR